MEKFSELRYSSEVKGAILCVYVRGLPGSKPGYEVYLISNVGLFNFQSKLLSGKVFPQDIFRSVTYSTYCIHNVYILSLP